MWVWSNSCRIQSILTDRQVVYGDTDSVFVNSNETELDLALKIAHQFKKQVNDQYELLEIDVDGVFQRLLLLQKKKYAAMKVEGGKLSMEVKGLDMKRREFSALSKNVSRSASLFPLSRIADLRQGGVGIHFVWR